MLLTACGSSSEDESRYTLTVNLNNTFNGDALISVNNQESLSFSTLIEDPDAFSQKNEKTFSYQFKTGEEYSLDITQQPDSQYCTLFSDSGVFGVDDIVARVTCSNYYRGLSEASEISINYNHACAIENSQVYCWQEDKSVQGGLTLLEVPVGIINPRKISTGYNESCIIDDSGIICWGDNFNTDIPESFSNPTDVKSGFFSTCALDDQGVSCWGTGVVPTYLDRHSDITGKLTSLTVGKDTACLLQDGKPVCWGWNVANFELLGIEQAQKIQLSQFGGCTLFEGDLNCWKVNRPEYVFDFSHINNIEDFEIAPDGFTMCVTANQVIHCQNFFGLEYKPELNVNHLAHSVTAMSVANDHICAIDAQGVICSSNTYSDLEVPQ